MSFRITSNNDQGVKLELMHSPKDECFVAKCFFKFLEYLNFVD